MIAEIAVEKMHKNFDIVISKVLHQNYKTTDAQFCDRARHNYGESR
jgi:hypothetical protein